ncbi:MAG: hypothetical protein KGZ62_06160 [Sulfurimonas sp.]|nr:hypothetical protein [Sulfurimonas sp.]
MSKRVFAKVEIAESLQVIDNASDLKTHKAKLAAVVTMDLPGIPRKRGRPRTGKALSNAERQRIHREKPAKVLQARLEAASESFSSETEADLLEWLVKAGPKLQEKAWLELGRRKGWKLP